MLTRNNVKDMYSLAPMQEGMYFHYIMDKDSPAYFEQMSYRVKGVLDCRLLERALNKLIERYDVLRTVFVYKNADKPRQVLLKKRETRIYFEDISQLNRENHQDYIEGFKKRDREAGFNLSVDMPLRLAVLKLSRDGFELVWSFHHIIMDGWCTAILVKEMMQIYFHLKSGNPAPPVLPPTTPYSYYIRWLEKQDKEKSLGYWKKYLENYETRAVIPGFKQERDPIYNAAVYSFRADPDLTRQLNRLSSQNNVTTAVIFQVLWGVLLQKYNNVEDVVFGAVVSGRPPGIPGIDTMIGLFINTIPLRVCCPPGQAFECLLQDVQQQQVLSEKHQYLPLADIQSLTSLKQDLLDHIVIFENYPVARELENAVKEQDAGTDKGFVVTDYRSFERTNYHLDVVVVPGNELRVRIRYNAAVYHPYLIEKIGGHFLQIAAQAVTHGGIHIGDMELLTESERKQLVDDFNNTRTPYPGEQTIHGLIARQVERTPDRIAVKDKNQALTYRELNDKSSGLALLLRQKGAAAGIIAALILERSAALMVGLLAILKTGAAYLPIDPVYPQARIDYILADSGAGIVLEEPLPHIPAAFPGQCRQPSSPLAYVIYTSGSTGKPKGVMIEHRAVINFITGITGMIDFNPGDTILSLTTLSFDIFVLETILPLTRGSVVVIGSREAQLDAGLAAGVMLDQKVTILQVTPSRLSLFLSGQEPVKALRALKYLLIGGEALPVHLWEQVGKRITGTGIYNLYGPTETTVWSTVKDLTKGKSLNIGTPISNTYIFILNKHLLMLPVGITGEIHIGGSGLARGYINNPELTADKFLVYYRSYRTNRTYIPSKKIYKTGDLGRWLPNGELEFLGRADHQVKIRGFRVELEEIEVQLLKLAGVKEAVVIAVETGDPHLRAFLAMSRELNIPRLHNHLSRSLPDYMIPSYFIKVDRIPVTSNGKVDRQALLRMDAGSADMGTAYEPPKTEIEKKLADIWQEVLGVTRPGIRDNFFHLGGHSIKAIRLAARIHKRLNKEIPLKTIFDHPTIKALSGIIQGAEKNGYLSMEPVEERDYYPVSPAQNRLYVLQQMALSALAYNVPTTMVLEEEPPRQKLEAVFHRLIRRHRSLRTSFHLIDGQTQPVQRVHRDVEFALEKNRTAVSEVVRPFDLSRAPLLRAALLQTDRGKFLLVVDLHHIISDGYSNLVLRDDFMRLYRDGVLPPLRLRYNDFSQWQAGLKRGPRMKQQEAWWLRHLGGELPVLDMPLDFPRPSIYSFEGNSIDFELAGKETRELKQMARSGNTTLYILLLTIFNLLLSKITAQEEIIVGTPIVGRSHADLEKVIGMFVNTIALRNYPAAHKTVNAFLQEVDKRSVQAFENQDYPFEDLVEKVQVQRDTSRNPLFDVVFSFHDTDTDTDTGTEENRRKQGGKNAEIYRYEKGTSKFDITLYSVVLGDRIACTLQYREKLFKKETVRRFAGYFKHLVSMVLSAPFQAIAAIEIISKEEKKRLLADLNNIPVHYPGDKTICGLFAEQVERTPDSVALVGKGEKIGETVQLTYGELKRKSDQVAQWLREKGVQPDIIVGIMVERSIEMITGILGILRAGGAYLPIDPDYPPERIDFMLKDSNAGILLKKFETNSFEFRAFRASDLPSSGSLAYIIYTSGSTGKPKGCLITHRCVVRLLFNDKFQFQFNRNDVWTLFHSYNFDFSVWEMYGALLYGGKLLIVPGVLTRDPDRFLDVLKERQVTVLNQTPSAFYRLLPLELRDPAGHLALRYIIFGGEALAPARLNQWAGKYPRTKLINMFGITETTVHVTYKEITALDMAAGTGNIGTPLPTTAVYVVDPRQNPLPVGIPGELWVSGHGVARGYLNQPELTAAKFIRRPLAGGRRLYCSGDRVKLNHSGQLEYLGRMDHQVQLRGFRIELGEIERVLSAHNAVRDAVVHSPPTAGSSGTLCAYVVLTRDIRLPELREYLKSKLPAYMVPHYFVKLEAIPLTPNGKVNRGALPLPRPTAESDYTAPRGRLQERMAGIWKEVLNLESVGITDNYFDAGGDSIKAIRLIGTINKQLNTALKIVDLYNHQTIEQLSDVIGTRQPVLSRTDEAETRVRNEIKRLEQTILALHPNPGEIEAVFPMGDIEKAMLYHYIKDAGTAVYHDQTAYQLPYRDFDIRRMNRALELLLEKHPILRSGFDIEHQAKIVYKTGSLINHRQLVQLEDISHLEPGRQESHIAGHAAASRQNPFNAAKAPLWRMRFFKINPGNIVISWEFHHAIIDGWSNASFLTELNNTYLRLKSHGQFVPDPLKTAYRDFVVSQLVEKQELSTGSVRDYWREELRDYKRLTFPPTRGADGLKKITRALDPVLFDRLKAAASRYGIHIKHLCFAAYAFMLSMFSYHNDFVVGLVSNTRPEIEDGDRFLGCFLNTIPVRVNILPARPFTWGQYCRWVDEKMLELKAYDKCSLESITQFIGEKTHTGNPLFDVYFNYINFYAYDQLKSDQAGQAAADTGNNRDEPRLSLVNYEKTNTMFDFALRGIGGQVMILFSYSHALISDETAQKCCLYFQALLKLFIDNHNDQIGKLAVMPLEERRRLLGEFNRPGREYPRSPGTSVLDLFRARVERMPDNIAVVGTRTAPAVPGEKYSISYKELNEKSRLLSRLLREKGVQPGTIVGIMIPRSLEMLTAILGVLNAGAAYLPIDPAYPRERVDYMLEDSGAKILLTGLSEGPGLHHSSNQFIIHNCNNPAYVIYTSGSSGRPKGVMIDHRNLVHFAAAITAEIPFEPGNAILCLTTISFDIFVLETLVPLTRGLTIVMADERQQNDPRLLEQLLENTAVTIMQVTPSRLKALLDSGRGKQILARLFHLIVGGEAFPVSLFHPVKEILENTPCRLYNVYGPTETTVWSTIKDLTPAGAVTIGKPMVNNRVYLLDSRLQPVPAGVPGELYIGGKQLARGYINNPELTADKFLVYYRSYRTNRTYIPSKRIYKTGDLACWLEDGSLEFLQRIDQQVKIRGFRIELEEIESWLLKHPAIDEAVVTAGQDGDGDWYLAAFIVTGAELTVTGLRDFLARELPGYMIPARFSTIDAVPLTANGKKDRKALAVTDGASPGLGVTYVEPQTRLEKDISLIWGEILKKDAVGIDDNFFDLGGNSMDLMKLGSRLGRFLGREIPVLTLFRYPTVRSFSSCLDRQFGESEAKTDLNQREEDLQEVMQIFEEI